MKIYLPWKIIGWDGRKHRSKLEITYTHTQQEELRRASEQNRTKKKR